MHNKFLLLFNRNDTKRKNVFTKFKANKVDFIEYDQIFAPLHVNNNHLSLPIIDLYEHNKLKSFIKLLFFKNKLNTYLSFFFTGVYLSYILVLIQYYVMILL